MSLVLSVLSIFVSLGSCFYAERSARSAKDSHLRLAEANANGLGPLIYLDEKTKPDSGRYFMHFGIPAVLQSAPSANYDEYILLKQVEPLSQFSTPGDDDKEIFVFFEATFYNQGSRTTSICAESSVVGERNIFGIQHYKDAKFVIKPSEKKTVIFFIGMAVKEWFLLRTSSAPETRKFKISASIEPEASSQIWEVKVDTNYFSPDPMNIGTALSVSSQMPTVSARELTRHFPEKSRKHLFRKRQAPNPEVTPTMAKGLPRMGSI